MEHKKSLLIYCLICTLSLLSSCYKKDIQFGSGLGETFTNLVQVDTVSVNISTYLLDSFPTSGTGSFLAGKYKDPVLGMVSTRGYLQMALPTDLSLADDAVYDSLVLVIKPNGYFYGDSTKAQTIVVNELADPIDYTYNSYLFNVDSIAGKKEILGSKAVLIRPNTSDSIRIKLRDITGADFFGKLKAKANEIQTAADFTTYFKGISIATGNNDTSMVFGIPANADSLYMRLHYHTVIPYPVAAFKDFPVQTGNPYFTQILADRKGTAMASWLGTRTYPSTASNNQSYDQPGTGLLLKMTFPSLRNLLQLNSTVKLLSARLILPVANGNWDYYKLRLPQSLFLATTDGTNNIGTEVKDSTGTTTLHSAPAYDNFYDSNPYYYFNITSSISSLLNSSGTTENGFFLLENYPGTTKGINRAIFNSAQAATARPQLILSFLTVNK